MTLLVQVRLSPPNTSPWCSGSTSAFQADWAGSNPVGDSSRGVVHLCSISFGWPGYSGPSSYGRLAQSDRAGAYEAPGRRFESCILLHLGFAILQKPFFAKTGICRVKPAIRRVRVTVAQRSRKPTWTSAMGSWGFESSTFRHSGNCAR